MNILITGGTGYIGSHTAVELINQNHTVTLLDNLSNSSSVVVDRIQQITGTRPELAVFDLEDKYKTNALFASNSFDAVIHFAALKAVGESVEMPLPYYRVNLDATMTLLEAMKSYNVSKLVFSSSATVYGKAPVPYSEESETGHGITNPYGQTKYMIEQMLRDIAAADSNIAVSSLRYFNPVGAHESGLIGEDPQGVPNNLMPFVVQVASGRREKLSIFGNEYDTKDGTCERDYIHVVDLAKGHIAALNHLKPGFTPYNLGSGKGTSVLELVNTFSRTTGKQVYYEFAPPRAGDLPAFWADSSKAKAELGWEVTSTIEDMCRDSWNWQSKNPDGFN